VSIGRRSVTQDPIEQALDKLGSLGVPVAEIGEKAGALLGQFGSFDLFEIVDQVGAIDPSQIDVGEIFGELKAKFDELDPAVKVPVAVAAGFVGARVVRWIVR
jgi:hypothetical protein